jgi:hypothetical protein
MRILRRAAIGVVVAAWAGLGGPGIRADEGKAPPDPAEARAQGLAWLEAHQNPDGSWGKTYSVAVTSLACLAHLAATDEPYEGERAKPLVRGIEWLLAGQKDGTFPKQGHTWIHGQGFATLALAEAYGRTLFAKAKPDLDPAKVKAVVVAAAQAVQDHQSASGGWWYTPDSPGQHEGSTTVCAVQALVSASNFGVPIDEKVLDRGFEYLKRCQNPDGGFDYQEGPGTTSMKEGTAADVATLALMKRFDYEVMVNGTQFLKKIGAGAISAERFPYYGHFYACMGLRLFGEEMGASDDAKTYEKAAVADLLSWRQADGSWPMKGWMTNQGEDGSYATAFAVLILSVPDARLSILRRTPPVLPAAPHDAAHPN